MPNPVNSNTSGLKDRDLPAMREIRKVENIESIYKKVTIYASHRFNGEPLRVIGACLGIGESAVSLSSNRFSQTLKSNRKRLIK